MANYSKFNLFFRSFIFSIFSLASVIFYSFIVLAATFTPLRFRHFLLRGFLHVYLKMLSWICLIDYEVEGLEHIPKDRAGVVMSKHQSTWETFYLPTIFHSPAVI